VKMLKATLWVAACLLVWNGVASAADSPHLYVGVKKCKTCHNSEKGGAQFKIWSESKHAQAFATLASDKAKEIAKEKGIEDPQKSDECLGCHVTGHGEKAEMFKPTFVAEDGVGCESCHGAGSDYLKKSVMQGIRDKSMKAEDYGFVMPTQETCDKCHNEKGTGGKKIVFKEAYEKIKHDIPEGFKRGGAAEGEGGGE
jgi:hypothetical protein